MIRFPFELERREPYLFELLDAAEKFEKEEFERRLAAMPEKAPEPLPLRVDRFQSIDDPPLELDRYTPKLTVELTVEQEEVIEESLKTSVAVYAGPGSGKTFCLVERVKRLAERMNPQDILCVTFTKAAAHGMKSRSGVDAEFRTTHSLAYKILSADGSFYRVLNDAKLRSRIQRHLEPGMNLDEFIAKWTYHKCSDTGPNGMQRYPFRLGENPLVALDDLEFRDEEEERFWRVAAEVTLEMLNRNELTYDDMLLFARDKIETGRYIPRWRDISIDEAHDLNRAQFNFIQAIVDKTSARLFVLASPEQSIYSFRYALPKVLEEFIARNGLKKMRLMLNHRAGQVLVRYANRVFDVSKPANLGSEGSVIWLGEYPDVFSEAFDVVKRAHNIRASCAILARTNSATVPVITACVDLGVHYRAVRTFLDSPVTRCVQDLILLHMGLLDMDSPEALWLRRYLMIDRRRLERLLPEMHDPQAALSVIMKRIAPESMLRGDQDDDALLKWLFEASKRFMNHTQFLEFLEKAKVLQDKDATLTVGTIHSVKGLEFDVVFLIGLNEGLLPHLRNPLLDEEKRVFYVGITRAKRRLYLSSHRTRGAKASRFLELLRLKPGVNK